MAEPTLTKEQTVSELFALRAGLSQISKNSTEVRTTELHFLDRFEKAQEEKHESIKKDFCNKATDAEKSIQDKINRIQADEATVGEFGDYPELAQYSTMTISEIKEGLSNVGKKVEKPKPSALRTIRARRAFGILGIPLFILCVILLVFTTKEGKIPLALYFCIVGLSICRYIFYGMKIHSTSDSADPDARSLKIFKQRMQEYDNYAALRKQCDIAVENIIKWYEIVKPQKIEELQNTILNIRKLLDESLENEDKRFVKEMKELVEKDEKDREENNDKIKKLIDNSKEIEKAMSAQYRWIAKSDWGNVDLIIYYLQTGRADDVKEALSQVDRQLQANQIANAVENSAKYICETITDVMNKCNAKTVQAIENSTGKINEKIDAVGRVMFGIQSSINVLAGRIEESVEQNNLIAERNEATQRELLSATQLNNALLEEANKTSDTLLNDLRYQQRYWVQ